MHPKKFILSLLIVAVVVLLVISLAAAQPSLAVTNATASQTRGSPLGELSGGQYRLLNTHLSSGDTPGVALQGGLYTLKPLDVVNDTSGCCCKNHLPCIVK